MRWRRQLPAYSPLPARAVLAGIVGLLREKTGGGVAEDLVEEFGCDELLLTDSGTSALTLAIRGSLTSQPGAAVALPAYSCYSLATAADGAGAPVLLYDVDPATLTPEMGSLRRALDRGARAVVLVHLFGVPLDPGPVQEAAREAGASLIQDVAQGAGARWQGRPLGSSGDLSVLSFGRGKGNTAGRGGALLAYGPRAEDILTRVRRDLERPRVGTKELVQLAGQWLFGRPSLFAIPSALPFLQLGETLYHPATPTRGMSRVARRVLATTLPLGQAEASLRRARAARLRACRGPGLVPLREAPGGEPGYLRLPFVAAVGSRVAAETPEARALGIMPGYPRALCDLPGFGERVGNRGGGFEGARLLAERLLTVPVHSRLSAREVEAVAAWVASRRETDFASDTDSSVGRKAPSRGGTGPSRTSRPRRTSP